MDYQKIYNSLIDRGKTRPKLNCYVEKHHVIPVCMNGLDAEENLVELTPEEHYVAHQLLVKIYPDHPGLIYAVTQIGSIGSNKLYGWLRRRSAEATSKRFLGKKKTATHKSKISLVQLGKKRGPYQKHVSHRKSRLGHKIGSMSEIAKSRISVSMKGKKRKPLSADHKAKISQSLKNLHLSHNGIAPLS